MSTQIGLWYDMALRQMAAESYFENVDLLAEDEVAEQLRLGNNRTGFTRLDGTEAGFTRFADSQVEHFVSKFQIVHQMSDDPRRPRSGSPYFAESGVLANTGLSATLIRRKTASGDLTNEYTLAIRSTEYRPVAQGGDRDRDVFGADLQGILSSGFALAQLAALNDYFAWLKSSGKLPPGSVLDVTGYSLGGHLATVFTEMHASDIEGMLNRTYTFNGAGRGTWSRNASDPSAIVSYYRAVLFDPSLAMQWAELGNGGVPNDEVVRALYADASSRSATGQPFDAVSIYGDPRHEWAQFAARQQFGLSGASVLDQGGLDLRNGAAERITQIYGKEFPIEVTGVANAGVHGPATGVFVEAQPFLEGGLPDWVPILGSASGWGNAHALLLIVDALAVMRVYEMIDPAITLDSLNQILSALSNKRAHSGISGDGEGVLAEDDPLENALDALRRLFLGEGVAPTRYRGGASGFGDLAMREGLHSNIAELTDKIAALTVAGGIQFSIEALVGLPSAAIEGLARLDDDVGRAYRYALKNLNPFVVLVAGDAQLDAYSDPAIATYNLEGSQQGLTSAYLKDRAEYVAWMIQRNLENTKTALRRPGVSGAAEYRDVASGGIAVYIDGPTGTLTPNPTRKRVLFGDEGTDTLIAGDLSDRLYSGGGADILEGGKGNDYLEGGGGMDTYIYRAETSFLQPNWNDGDDEIRDTDGQGVILYTFTGSGGTGTSSRAIGGIALKQAEGRWQSTDGKFVYEREDKDLRVRIMGDAGGSLLIRDFDFAAASQTGSFGVRLVEAVAPNPSNDREFEGDRRILGSYSTVDPVTGNVVWHEPEVILRDEFGNVIWDPNLVLENVADVFHGSPDSDAIYGRGGNDRLFGEGGDDLLLGGGGSDYIDGGTGDDVISGHDPEAGQVPLYDELHGGEGNDLIFAGAIQALEETFETGGSELIGDTSRIYGEAGDDILVGSSLIDFIYGGAGDDLIVDGKDGVLHGDEGDDVLYAFGGDASMVGGMGTDTLVVDDPSPNSFGSEMNGGPNGYGPGDGDDILIGSSSGRDRMQGGDGSDLIFAGGGNDSFADSYWAYFASDTIYMGEGDDAVSASHGDDFIDGGLGNDNLGGGGGDDVIHGGPGNDRLDGGVFVLAAQDPGNGGSLIFVPVESGDDVLYGEEGDDALFGREGDDTLDGDVGNDQLDGGADTDWLNAGASNDSIDGGAGGDIYFFDAGDGLDAVFDFDGGQEGDDAFFFGEGIEPEQLVLMASPFDSRLFVSIPSTGQRIDVRSWFVDAGGFGGEQFRIESFVFADGTTWNQAQIAAAIAIGGPTPGTDRLAGSVGDDLIRGLAGADTITDAAGDDILFGDEHSDRIMDSEGHNLLLGGDGNDVLRLNGIPILGDEGEEIGLVGDGSPGSFAIGGAGQDSVRIDDRSVVAYNSGDGEDSVQWIAGDARTLTISLGGGVGVNDIAIVRESFRLMLYTGTEIPPNEDDLPLPQRAIGLPNLLAAQEVWPALVLQVIDEDIRTYDLGQVLEDFFAALDRDPSITRWAAGEVLAANLLDISTTHAIGGAIAYQYATTGTVEGLTPEQIRGVLTSVDFGLVPQPIEPSNPDAGPLVSNAIADQSANEDAAFTFAVPADAFFDPDAGDALSYAAALEHGSALPGWLAFDGETQIFSGTPLQSDVGTLQVAVTATDTGGLSATDTFTLKIANVNDAPVVASSLADASFEAGAPFALAVPEGTFYDEDTGDTLTLSATSFNGTALPSWLTFDPARAVFTGTPTVTDYGISHILVTAADGAGVTAQSDFGLVVRVPAGVEATGSAGDDVIYGSTGDETLTAKGGSDYLYGDVGNDLLKGGGGNDVLQSGAGNDVLRGGKGQNVLDGGVGDDLIFGGQGSAFIVGGAGNDTLRVGSGNDVIAFNAGDGMDTIYGGRDGGNTLSFGGGIRYSDLTLSKSGKDLVVSTGAGEGVTLKNWYAGNRSVLNLQIVLDATEEFDATSADLLHNRRVQSFDFLGMVSAYDAVRAATPGFTSWEITNALLAFHLAGADDVALGGDLAYWYGKNRTLAGISLQSAQQVIGAANFGSEAQSLRPFSGLQEGFVKLA